MLWFILLTGYDVGHLTSFQHLILAQKTPYVLFSVQAILVSILFAEFGRRLSCSIVTLIPAKSPLGHQREETEIIRAREIARG